MKLANISQTECLHTVGNIGNFNYLCVKSINVARLTNRVTTLSENNLYSFVYKVYN